MVCARACVLACVRACACGVCALNDGEGSVLYFNFELKDSRFYCILSNVILGYHFYINRVFYELPWNFINNEAYLLYEPGRKEIRSQVAKFEGVGIFQMGYKQISSGTPHLPLQNNLAKQILIKTHATLTRNNISFKGRTL